MKKGLDGKIAIPYNWTAGRATSRFLTALRDKAKFVASSCEKCGKKYLPPLSFCPACFERIENYIEIDAAGELLEYTVVHKNQQDDSSEEIPRVLGIVKIDGADTPFLHRILVHPEEVEVGMRVRARFRPEREGSILDVEGFEKE
ncbi:MAG: Zn-ribbon domain-containing OB-fold protein [bacterium]